MKKLITLILSLLVMLSIASVAEARNTRYLLPINTALTPQYTSGKLDGTVKFYFGAQRHPAVLKRLGTDITNRKTNAFAKTDQVACEWAFLSALIALQNRAHQLGANSVINIVSFYDKKEMASTSTYECRAGGVIAGVVLKGDFVKLAV